ncbi:hypothetical protein TSOC_002641 [Tetrabaena socialis]|uniref:Uncharacterized protein n=1 Tax=Tetrabaena socialis TaxID=47790 RepID=A0A2J8ADL8_9CHLO|nr:hypothetical protein TSOC_002641 [Tetrabaena socialis]|eukprot:PNH10620.1 hypothetical protein TSOC_002641 [Tetrabaena socialis]
MAEGEALADSLLRLVPADGGPGGGGRPLAGRGSVWRLACGRLPGRQLGWLLLPAKEAELEEKGEGEAMDVDAGAVAAGRVGRGAEPSGAAAAGGSGGGGSGAAVTNEAACGGVVLPALALVRVQRQQRVYALCTDAAPRWWLESFRGQQASALLCGLYGHQAPGNLERERESGGVGVGLAPSVNPPHRGRLDRA